MDQSIIPDVFVEELRQLLESMSTRRGVKRGDIRKSICVKVGNYIKEQRSTILTLHNKLLLSHGDTNNTLRKRIDEKNCELEEQKKRIKHLENLRKRLNEFGDRRVKELADLRKKYGCELPTFLDDTELT